jgi:hypothetical protein
LVGIHILLRIEVDDMHFGHDPENFAISDKSIARKVYSEPASSKLSIAGLQYSPR